MQSKKPYFEISLLGNPRKKWHKIIFIIFIVIFCLFFVIFITVKMVGVISTSGISPQTFYYIYVNTGEKDTTKAEKIANTYRVRGAAGLVMNGDEYWIVLLSLYPKLSDAENVCKQLSSEENPPKIASVTTAKISTEKMDENQRKIAENIYSHYIETINSLYETTVSLDTGAMTESSAQVRVNQLLLLWQQRTETLANAIDLTTDTSNHPLLKIYNLSMQITGLLVFLADEKDYSVNLVTYTSLARKVTIQLAQIAL